MLEHINSAWLAALDHTIAPENWIDLSTGVSPISYTIGHIPQEVWHHLPGKESPLTAAAAEYYGTPYIIASAGSLAAIQALPRLRKPCLVAVLETSYKEHAHAWSNSGHELMKITDEQLEAASATADVVVLCNPNNPTGLTFQRHRLHMCLKLLETRGGWLVIDEAFMDVTQQESVVRDVGQAGLIVLRSLGKFFGLAGARVGFVAAWPELLATLEQHLGQWTLSAPSEFVATKALLDREFHDKARSELSKASEAMREILTENGLTPNGSTAFFHWICTDQAEHIHKYLLTHGIRTRLELSPLSIRFGLTSDSQKLERLAKALASKPSPPALQN